MPASNTLYILGADATGVVTGARQAQTAIDGMVGHAQSANGRLMKAQQGLFNQTAQLSFAAQDVFTVLFMGGGMERALLAASNNIGFIASQSGTIKGALIGVGVVLGAVIVPRMNEWLAGQKQINEALEQYQQIRQGIVNAGNEAADDVRFQQSLRDAQTPEDVQRIIDSEQNRFEQLQAAVAEHQLRVGDLRAQVEEMRGPMPGVWLVDDLLGGRAPDDNRSAIARAWDETVNALLFDIPKTGREQLLEELEQQLEGASGDLADKEEEMMEAFDRIHQAQERMALGEQEVDLLKEINRMLETRTSLLQRGSVEEANARLDAQRTVFDQRLRGQIQMLQGGNRDNNLRDVLGDLTSELGNLNDALDRGQGMALVPVEGG